MTPTSTGPGAGATALGAVASVAVVAVRAGELPLGGDEAVAEAGGVAVLVGEGAEAAAASLAGLADRVLCWDQPSYAPGAWAAALAPLLEAATVVVLPASPDGRDLAPRLAHRLGRPLLAGAVQVGPEGAVLARQGGLVMEEVVVDGPFVVTLQPGVRGVEVVAGRSMDVVALALPDDRRGSGTSGDGPARGATPPSSPCCRPTRPPWTWPRPRASSAAAPAWATGRSWISWRRWPMPWGARSVAPGW